MKRLTFTISLIMLGLISSTTSFGQDDVSVMSKKEQRQMAREKKLADKRAQTEELNQLTRQMIKQRRFVLEASTLSGKSGRTYPVNSSINFIIVDSSEATIQLGTPTGMGYNGVGGITIDGSISRYKVTEKETKRGTSYYVSMYIFSSLGTYDLNIWISYSGKADAKIKGNTSGQLNYSGQIVPIGLSKIYKGSAFP